MGAPQEQDVKRTHSLFIDDLKVYQDDHKKLEVVNEIIMKASMDTGACYGLRSWKKWWEEKVLTVLEERMKTLDPDINEVYKF